MSSSPPTSGAAMTVCRRRRRWWGGWGRTTCGTRPGIGPPAAVTVPDTTPAQSEPSAERDTAAAGRAPVDSDLPACGDPPAGEEPPEGGGEEPAPGVIPPVTAGSGTAPADRDPPRSCPSEAGGRRRCRGPGRPVENPQWPVGVKSPVPAGTAGERAAPGLQGRSERAQVGPPSQRRLAGGDQQRHGAASRNRNTIEAGQFGHSAINVQDEESTTAVSTDTIHK